MAKNKRSYNGSLIYVGGGTSPLAKVISCHHEEVAKEVDVTASDDTQELTEAGIPGHALDVEIYGTGSSLTVGNSYTVEFEWKDGTTEDVGLCVLLNRNRGGEINGKLTAKLKFKPTTPDDTE